MAKDTGGVKGTGRFSGGGGTFSMRRRLLGFLLAFTLAIAAGAAMSFVFFGTFGYGVADDAGMIAERLELLGGGLSRQYGSSSVQAARLSERLARGVEEFRKLGQLSPEYLKTAPEQLAPLLTQLLPILENSLDATDCSGVFVALDATVNPALPGAGSSKAGLYIRTIEPNIDGMGSESRYLMRGPFSLTGDGRIYLQARWRLEFDVAGAEFWSRPLAELAKNPGLPLSRLTYWCSTGAALGLSEDVMLCSVPVMGADGPIGVCGFEISQMNFMLRREPGTDYHRAVFLLARSESGGLVLDEALYSGNTAVYGAFPPGGRLWRLTDAAANSPGLYAQGEDTAASYVGMEREIKLYPDGSPFAGRSYRAALLIPKEDFDAAQNSSRLRVLAAVLAVLAAGCLISFAISHRYVKPIADTLAAAGENAALDKKTNIAEIDALLEKLRELSLADAPIPEDLFEDFFARAKTLTPTESEIFRLYAAGLSAAGVVARMSLSANTLKNHNTHIYRKLGVTSRDDLLLYVELIRKSGMFHKMP